MDSGNLERIFEEGFLSGQFPTTSEEMEKRLGVISKRQSELEELELRVESLQRKSGKRFGLHLARNKRRLEIKQQRKARKLNKRKCK